MTTVPPPFLDSLASAKAANASHLCIGLDPDPARLPEVLGDARGLVTFCREIIEATADLVCAFKPNVAFFERWGAEGWQALHEVARAVPSRIPVIADAKRGDIGSTSAAYAEALYDRLGVSACTVSPYLGVDAVRPLLDHPGGFAFLLCRTSNAGAGAIQDMMVEGEPLYARVIRLFAPWLADGRAGLVIGAQEREAFAWAARLAPNAPLLVPGIGAQGGTAAALGAVLGSGQTARVVVNVSRAVIHAGGGTGYVASARHAALAIRAELNQALGAADGERADGTG